MSTPRHRRVSTQTFFGFSIQDKYLSEIRLEAKQQKESSICVTLWAER